MDINLITPKKTMANAAVLFCAMALASIFAHATAMPHADYVFTNAKAYTVNKQQPWAKTIAVQKNRIIYVGQHLPSRLIGKNTKIVDVAGKMILPGLIDSHVHPIWGGEGFMQVNLKAANNMAELQQLLINFRDQNPNLKYISGGGWRTTKFSETTLLKEKIDAVVSDIPVLLYDDIGHSALANSAALNQAGLNRDTADPAGGHFVRDSNGNLTGLAKEAPAYEIISHILPEDKNSNYKALKLALNYLNKNGITSFVTAYAVGDPMGQAFIDLYNDGQLTARTSIGFKVSKNKPIDKTLSRIQTRRAILNAVDQDFIKANMAKLYLDGVVENHTAVMLKPYQPPHHHHQYNPYIFSNDDINHYTSELDKAGFQLHFHAIGDGASRQALDTIENLIKVNGKTDRRVTISHLLSVSPDDFDRFKALDVSANAQFLWSRYTEGKKNLESHFGKERSKWIYANGALKKAGATFVGGSDWPVSTANPFAAMQIAATRPRVNGQHGQSWLPTQKIDDIEFLIAAFTINGARLQYREHMIGSLEVGKMADMIIIDQNILEIPVAKLANTQVLMTMLNGKIIYQNGL